MPSTVCLTDEDVAAFVTQSLDERRRAEVEAHLDTCSVCLELVGELGRVFDSVSAVAPESSDAVVSLGQGDRDLSVLLQAMLQDQQIGPYVIERLVGWGGAAVVYAGRDQRLDRPVALKIIAAEGVAPEPLKEEARLVAQLEHPNVVAVYDVREEQGRVIIVMELVTGGTLRTWQRGRSRAAILAMYRAAGQGLVAAHDAGLVHRDFKPDNVLVGDDGRPRVGDFGLAATIAQPTSEEASRSTSSVVGTPRYMSPEQRRGDRVDARTDQYAFCVALLEALSASSEIDQGLAELPGALARPLRRGLQPEAEHRFPSMRALLEALAPSRRWPTALLGATALGLVAFFAWPRTPDDACPATAEEARSQWTADRREALKSAFVTADPTLGPATWERVELVLDRWVDDWSTRRVAACRAARASDASDVEARRRCLEHGLREAEAWLEVLGEIDRTGVHRAVEGTADLPELARCDHPNEDAPPDLPEALVQSRAARRLGDYERAYTLAHDRLAEGGIDDERVLSAVRYDIAIAAAHSDHESEAVSQYTEAYWNASAAGDVRLMVQAAGGLAHHLAARESKPAEAEPWLEHARAAAARAPDDARIQADVIATGASIATVRGDHAAAAEALERAIELRREANADPSRIAALLGNLAVALERAGELPRAEQIGREALAALERALGPEHPDTASAHNTLGTILSAMLRYDDALVEHERALEIREALFGPDHPQTAAVVSNIAQLYDSTGRKDEAIAFYQRALATTRRREPVNPANLAIMLSNLAGVYVGKKQYADAKPLVDEALTLLTDTFGAEHPVVATIGANAASLHSRLGDYAFADEQCPRSLAALQAKFGEEHPRLVGPLTNCGEHDLRVARLDEARVRLRRARAIVTANRAGFDRATRSTVTFALARALAPDPATEDEARRLAEEALLDVAGDFTAPASDLEELAAWLHDHEKR